MLILRLTLFKRFLTTFFVPSFFLLIQSCSQTPIGQELSDSFDSPIETKVQNDSLSEEGKTASKTKVLNEQNEKTLSLEKINKKRETRITQKKSDYQFKASEKKSSFNPQPYRITIKLSAANPSAPAESVTKALRLAGVEFEVEMIQLIQDEPSSQQKRVGRTNR